MANDWKEQRRLRAWDLFNNGWKQSDIAEALGVSAGAVSQWLSAARQYGVEALRARQHPGAARRLSPEQDRQLIEMLKQSPTTHGFLVQVWTTRRVGDLIKRTFGISYHTDHVGRILHRLGFSVQKPRLRVSTWAPVGQTPVLEHTQGREHLSVIGGVTQDGRLLTMSYEESINSQRCVAFLRHLVRQLGKVLVIWDGAPIHRSRVVREYLSGEGKGRVHLERLPAYAPEVNPEEGVWQLLKLHELANVCARNMRELRREVRLGIQRLRQKLSQLQACFHQVGYI